MSNIPSELKYAPSHEWVRNEGDGTYTVGISEHAQELWFDSKDLGEWVGEQVSIIGRADNQFISGGENIHCEEIERALNQLPEVKQAFIVPVEDREFGFRPVAIVDCDQVPTKDWFAEQLQGSLERFKFPIEYHRMPEQEQLGIKVSRAGLAQWLLQHRRSN